MAISFTCPACKSKSAAPDEAVGRKVKCPHCGTVLGIPALADKDRAGAITPPRDSSPETVACPHCNGRVGRDERLAGQFVACPHCLENFQMPGATAPLPIPIAQLAPPDVETSSLETSSERAATKSRSRGQNSSKPGKRRKAGSWRILFLIIPCGLLVLCCGVCVITAVIGNQRLLEDADQLYAEGKHSEAVAKYESIYRRSGMRKGDIAKRIIEHHVKTGNLSAARAWINRSVADGVEVNFESPLAKEMLATIQREREEARSKENVEIEQRTAAEVKKIPSYIKGLRSSDPKTRVRAAKALEKLGSHAKDAVPDLVEAACPGSLSEFGEASAISSDILFLIGKDGLEQMQKIVEKDANPVKKVRVLRVWQRMKGDAKDAVPSIEIALGDECVIPFIGPRVKHCAAIALAEVAPDNPRSVAVLIESLYYDMDQRYAAIAALEKLGPAAKDALPALRAISEKFVPFTNEKQSMSSQLKNDVEDRKDARKAIRSIERK